MFLFHTIHFLKFLVKSRPRRCYKNGSYIEKKSVLHRERTNYRSQRHYSTQLQSKRNKSMQSCLTQNLALYSMAYSHAEATIVISDRAMGSMGSGQHFRPSWYELHYLELGIRKLQQTLDTVYITFIFQITITRETNLTKRN